LNCETSYRKKLIMADFFDEIEKKVNNYRPGPNMVRTACTVATGAVGATAGSATGAALTAAGASTVGGAITSASMSAVGAASSIPVVGSTLASVASTSAAAGTAIGTAAAAAAPILIPAALIVGAIWLFSDDD
jgi:hypothetical protein